MTLKEIVRMLKDVADDKPITVGFHLHSSIAGIRDRCMLSFVADFLEECEKDEPPEEYEKDING